MRCIAVDDEPFALELISDYIRKTPFLELVEGFTNPFKAMSFLSKTPVDLVFLDIQMPELSGIDLLKSLSHVPKVIFTTAFAEFGAESYEFNAIDFLLKPVKYDRFLKAVNKVDTTAHVSTEQQKDTILLKSGSQIFRIAIADILYVEGAGNYMTFYTKSGKIMSLLPMSEILKMLPTKTFIRIHKSYIVSLAHVEIIEKARVIINKIAVPIGITYREHFASIIRNEREFE
jgi:DNA-binding LytR/AlgR family response regulator